MGREAAPAPAGLRKLSWGRAHSLARRKPLAGTPPGSFALVPPGVLSSCQPR